MNFKITNTTIVHRGKVFDTKVDEIVYNESGNKGVRETAVHPGGAVVVPVKDDGKIIMITQFRFPHDQILIELPAGKLDPGEDPMICAGRELIEETGFTSENIVKLGKIFTTPGFCNEVLHIYLATNLRPGDHAREEGEEGMQVHEYTVEEIETKIKSGEIVDAKTICGITMYRLEGISDR